MVELSPGRGMSRDGHWALVLRLYNASTTTCRMQGWPLAFGLDENANLSGTAGHTLSGYFGGATGDEPPVIDLAPARRCPR